MHRNDVLSLLTLVVGICSLASDAGFSQQLSSLLPSHDAQIALAALGIVSTIASQVIRVLSVPAGPSTGTASSTVNPPPPGGTA